MNLFSRRLSSFQRSFLTSSALAVATTVSLVVAPPITQLVEANHSNNPKVVLNEAWNIVNRNYVDSTFNSVNWQRERQHLLGRNYTSREQAYTALRESLKKLNDPYTRFLTPEEFAALQTQTSGELVGVGIQLQLDESSGRIRVVKPIENSPAARAAIQPGDWLVNINGRSTQGMTLNETVQQIRGKVGTPVTLSFQRGQGNPFTVTLNRAQIGIPTVSTALREENGQKVGYIRLSQFNAHAGEQMQKAIRDFERQRVDGYVLDLRGNPGGLLGQAIAISRMWLNEGVIVQTVNRNGASRMAQANRTALTQKPLVILADNTSASASEILAGALQDNHRAIVVGTQTFGKGLVQSVNRLSDGSGLNVTINRYLTPSGTDINQRGITPDVLISLTDAQKKDIFSNADKLGTSADPQYKTAVSKLLGAIASN